MGGAPHTKLCRVPLPAAGTLLGSLSNDDGDGNENGKNVIGLD